MKLPFGNFILNEYIRNERMYIRKEENDIEVLDLAGALYWR